MTRRVVVLNNYPLERVWQQVRLGETSDRHLFGIDYFSERGYEPIVVPLSATIGERRHRWAGRLLVDCGNLLQQREALRRPRRGPGTRLGTADG